MKPKAQLQNAFFNAEDPVEENIYKQRQSTVYDAVAGRVSAAGFIPKHIAISSTRDTASSSISAVAPEAVLFRRKNAPTRYAESDVYFANERESKIDLPESDLLKALHCYTSDFYSRATTDTGVGDWRSMDETALIAFGILMEEASREVLGRTGDLAFTEGEEVDNLSKKKSPGRRTRSVSQAQSSSEIGTLGRTKRRRLLEDAKDTR